MNKKDLYVGSVLLILSFLFISMGVYFYAEEVGVLGVRPPERDEVIYNPYGSFTVMTDEPDAYIFIEDPDDMASFWWEGLDSWQNFDSNVIVPVDQGTEFWFDVPWLNNSDEPITGHIDFELTYPDNTTKSLDAWDESYQDYEADPGEGKPVTFSWNTDQVGLYYAEITLINKDTEEEMDSWEGGICEVLEEGDVTEHTVTVSTPDPDLGNLLLDGSSDLEQTFSDGQEINIYANPTEGYRVDYFEVNGETIQPDKDSVNPSTIGLTVDEDKEVIVHYEESPEVHSLDVEVEPIDGMRCGTIDVSPTRSEGLSNYEYEEGAEVKIEAEPSTDKHEFSEWSGDFTGDKNPITVTMDSDKTITAHFEENVPEEHTLSIDVDPSNVAEVYARSIDPGSTHEEIIHGTEVEVWTERTDGEDYVFDKWEVNNQYHSGSMNTTVKMDADKNAVAYWIQKQEDDAVLDLSSTDGGQTTIVEGQKAGSPGRTITIRADPNEGYEFVEWQGDVDTIDRTHQFTIEEDMTVNAVFEREEDDETISDYKSAISDYKSEILVIIGSIFMIAGAIFISRYVRDKP